VDFDFVSGSSYPFFFGSIGSKGVSKKKKTADASHQRARNSFPNSKNSTRELRKIGQSEAELCDLHVGSLRYKYRHRIVLLKTYRFMFVVNYMMTWHHIR
jgi:hypothetical protein